MSFRRKAIREFADEVAENELAHVRFYRKTLGRDGLRRCGALVERKEFVEAAAAIT